MISRKNDFLFYRNMGITTAYLTSKQFPDPLSIYHSGYYQMFQIKNNYGAFY